MVTMSEPPYPSSELPDSEGNISNDSDAEVNDGIDTISNHAAAEESPLIMPGRELSSHREFFIEAPESDSGILTETEIESQSQWNRRRTNELSSFRLSIGELLAGIKLPSRPLSNSRVQSRDNSPRISVTNIK